MEVGPATLRPAVRCVSCVTKEWHILADVASGLPDYEEKILVSSMDSEEDATGYSQRSAYNKVFEELRNELAAALKSGSKRLLATYLQTLLAYPDGCTRGGDGLRPP